MMRKPTIIALLLAAIFAVGLPEAAWALECSGGSASGDIFSPDHACSGGTGLDHIFSRIFCDFVTIVNDVLSKVYCTIQDEVRDTLQIVFTLYVAAFGAQILMGSVQMSVKEIMVRLLKIAGVWAFATQTYWAIQWAFVFFVQLGIFGAVWVWGGVEDGGQDVYNIGAGSSGDLMPIFAFFDQVVYDVVTGPFTMAHSEVIGFFFVMWYLIPTIFMLASYWLWVNFTILIRALLTFLIAVASLAFLLALSPLFLSFMLFTSTYQFFENWLKYMMSYSIQIIVVFSIVALWLAALNMFIGFFNELAEVIFPYDSLWVKSAAESDPVNTWGICPISYGDDPLLGPTASCEDSGFDPTDPDDAEKMIPAASIAMEGEFVYYVIYRLLALILVCYAFDTLMRQAPYMAKSLAGPEYVPILGQGYTFSKYGIIEKTPAWARKGLGGKGGSLIKDIDSTLGISKTTREAVKGLSSKYTQAMGGMLSRR